MSDPFLLLQAAIIIAGCLVITLCVLVVYLTILLYRMEAVLSKIRTLAPPTFLRDGAGRPLRERK